MSWWTARTVSPLTAISTRNTRDGDLPRCSKRIHAVGEPIITELEVIFFVAIKVATQATDLTAVVTRYCDCHMIDQVISDKQSKICSNNKTHAFLIDLHCSIIKIQRKVVKNSIHLKERQKEESLI